MIIAFSGKKQSGKSTAVKDCGALLVGLSGHVREVNFAGYLKEICRRCFGYPDMDTEKGKSELVITENDSTTVLGILLYLGSDVMRRIDRDCWVNAWKSTVQDIIKYTPEGSPEPMILTSDVRFPNEVKAVHDLGGKVIRLLRNPLEDNHESETALDDMEEHSIYACDYGQWQDYVIIPVQTEGMGFDAIIDNREMTIEQQNEAVRKVVQGWL